MNGILIYVPVLPSSIIIYLLLVLLNVARLPRVPPLQQRKGSAIAHWNDGERYCTRYKLRYGNFVTLLLLRLVPVVGNNARSHHEKPNKMYND